VRGFALARRRFASFDRRYEAHIELQQPDRYRLIDAIAADRARIARGSGVSYVAASFGNGAITQDMSAFDRLIAFDATHGHLTVEAGATVADVQRFALAHGWYLPVVPGHPRASVGGCIAADVHGKNPARDGTFRDWLEAFTLHPGDGSAVRVERSSGAELFEATCAGFGLTGVVSRATLRLARAPQSLVERRIPVANLAEAARVLREGANAPLLYGWHDARIASFGAGVIRVGLAGGESGPARPRTSADLPARIAPCPLPLWNRASIDAAQAMLAWRWARSGEAPIELERALFPLNGARGYFAAFGAAGMVESQWLIPHQRFEGFAAALGECVARLRPLITLVSSKLFAGTSSGLAFNGAGIALAIQLAAPAADRQRAFLEALGDLAIAHGGRPNLVKDSTLEAGTARRAIGDFDAARERLRRWDAAGRATSELARRLAL
jgi:decaprenylphospho-beta-D-ribofuranose 2-oxidase